MPAQYGARADGRIVTEPVMGAGWDITSRIPAPFWRRRFRTSPPTQYTRSHRRMLIQDWIGPVKESRSGVSLALVADHDPGRRSGRPCRAAARWSKLSGWPVRGWAKPSRAACSAWRGKSSSLPADRLGQRARDGRDAAQVDADRRPPGGPGLARCTRIWWVRPVARRHSSRATDGAPGAQRAVVGERRPCRCG